MKKDTKMADHYLRKYGVATTIDFQLYKLDGTGLKTDATSATHDIKIMKDEGAEADTTADAFVDEGQGYSLALTATEMQAARIVLYIVDQSGPQVWLDKCLIIETYGNASAQHIFDLGTATQNVNVASIDNIDFGATMKASINTEVDNALNTAIPGGPTADSINERIVAIDTDLPNIHTHASNADTQTVASVIGDAVLDEPVEGVLTLRKVTNIQTAALAGKASGGGTATIKFRDQADTKDRITATVDATGNRTAVTADGA
jgi:hypothetical protein